ncbi:hypothetical protein, partial [Thalassorhabdomicrobium marinisediminis]|uniref:hypothetical protein n=1 Tax=Thalassorhabdomicrobium marinisediminis TaxID=2170577 RepID=UPI002490BFB9
LYTVAYDLCDTNTPANCETAQIEVTVAADIAPGDDTGTATSGLANVAAVADVTANDLVNGAAVDLTAGTG